MRKKAIKPVRAIEKAKHRVCASSSSSDGEISVHDSSSNFSEHDEEDDEKVNIGDFVVTQVHGKTAASSGSYVAEVKECMVRGYTVKFLKRLMSSNRFVYLDEDDALILSSDVKCKLPKPAFCSQGRYENMLYFNTDLSSYCLY